MDRVFLRNLFTGRLRTRRPAYLAAMIFLGVTGTAQLVYSLTVLNANEGLGMIAFVGILGIVSVALLVNAVLSLLT